jgi:hypothetical protein
MKSGLRDIVWPYHTSPLLQDLLGPGDAFLEVQLYVFEEAAHLSQYKILNEEHQSTLTHQTINEVLVVLCSLHLRKRFEFVQIVTFLFSPSFIVRLHLDGLSR